MNFTGGTMKDPSWGRPWSTKIQVIIRRTTNQMMSCIGGNVDFRIANGDLISTISSLITETTRSWASVHRLKFFLLKIDGIFNRKSQRFIKMKKKLTMDTVGLCVQFSSYSSLFDTTPTDPDENTLSTLNPPCSTISR